MEKPKVSIVIPVYKPDEKIFAKVKEMIKKQTIKSEVIEMWNNPEAVSMNKGIMVAKGDIVVMLAQDCVPNQKDWLEKLIKPLENKIIVVTVSDLNLPEEFWKKYPLLTRILTITDLGIRRPEMDARACAFRKKDLIDVGMFNEDPRVIAIDGDIGKRLIKVGKFFHPNVFVDHLHILDDKKKIKTMYNYAEANGKLIRKYKEEKESFWIVVIRSLPFFGMIPNLFFISHSKKLIYVGHYLIGTMIHNLIYIYGFWKGFLFNKESMRNKEVLQEKKA